MKPELWKRNMHSPYSDRLSLDSPTLAKAMKKTGYATFFAGKWHLGPEGFWPENQGFDMNMGGTDKGGPNGGNKYFSPYGIPRLTDGPDGEHLPDRLASETNKFIEANKSQPFWTETVSCPFSEGTICPSGLSSGTTRITAIKAVHRPLRFGEVNTR